MTLGPQHFYLIVNWTHSHRLLPLHALFPSETQRVLISIRGLESNPYLLMTTVWFQSVKYRCLCNLNWDFLWIILSGRLTLPFLYINLTEPSFTHRQIDPFSVQWVVMNTFIIRDQSVAVTSQISLLSLLPSVLFLVLITVTDLFLITLGPNCKAFVVYNFLHYKLFQKNNCETHPCCLTNSEPTPLIVW